MTKKLFKMTESDVQNIAKKSIYNLIKEGTIYDEVDNMWSYFENTLGAEKNA